MDRHVTVTTPSGELDIGSLPEVDRLFLAVPPDDHMIIDLAAVSFVDSVMLSRFVRAARRHESAGGRVVLADARGPVRRVLAITQLDALLPYAADVAAARALVASLDAPDSDVG
jgi:anti-sigma B factor antagonist